MKASWIAIVPLALMAGLTGCSTASGIAKGDFSCAGPTPGTACIDSMSVYEITSDPLLQEAVIAELQRAAENEENVDPHEVLARIRAQQSPTIESVSNIVEPISQPKPILKPAQVVRIWIAPWVDRKGDLHMPGYVFSEITPRRWELGEPETGTATILAPVQLDRNTTGNSETPAIMQLEQQ